MAAETSATAAHPRVAKAGPPPRYLGGTPRGRGPTPRVSVPAPGRANWQSDAGNLFLPRRFLGGHPPATPIRADGGDGGEVEDYVLCDCRALR